MEPREPGPPGSQQPVRLARRAFCRRLGWGGLTALLALSVPETIRFLRPRPGRREAGTLDLGVIQDYAGVHVVTRWVVRHGLWVVRKDGRLFALEARCTHLGCTPRWTADEGVFRCPCHGSRFTIDGDVVNGPATRPLPRLAIRTEHDQVLVDPSRKAPLARAVRDAAFWVDA